MARVRVGSASTAVAEAMADISHESLGQSAELISFISSSAAWIYPVDRFFGRVLYEYYYDIDFIFCAGQEEVQERNKILYESYCHLVGCLMIKACMDYNIETSEIVKAITLVEVKPQLFNLISQGHFNYVRGVYGIDHFGYIMMSYCNHYKLMCCQDMLHILKESSAVDQSPDEILYVMFIQEVIKSLDENHSRIVEFLVSRDLPMMGEMRAGPFISLYGICLSDALHNQEYKSTIKRLLVERQEKLLTHRLKELQSLAGETPVEEEMSVDMGELIESLTKVTTMDEDFIVKPSGMSSPLQQHLAEFSDEIATMSCLQQHVTTPYPENSAVLANLPDSSAESSIKQQPSTSKKRTASARFSSEESYSDPTPAKRFLFQTDVSAPPSSPVAADQPSLPMDSSEVPAIAITSSDFEEENISPQLAAELTQASFNPTQYQTLEVLPDSEKTRRECLLHEYDRRLDLHIAHHTLEFMIFKTLENKPHLESIVDKQAIFAKAWPAPRKLHDTRVTTNQEETAIMSNLLQEAQSLIKQIQQAIDTLKS